VESFALLFSPKQLREQNRIIGCCISATFHYNSMTR